MKNFDLKKFSKELLTDIIGGLLLAFAVYNFASSAGFPVADAYSVWQVYARAGVDTTALLSNRINHPNAAMHDVFVQKIMEQLFE